MWLFIENLQPRSETKCKEKPCNCREEQQVENPVEMALTSEEQHKGLRGQGAITCSDRKFDAGLVEMSRWSVPAFQSQGEKAGGGFQLALVFCHFCFPKFILTLGGGSGVGMGCGNAQGKGEG